MKIVRKTLALAAALPIIVIAAPAKHLTLHEAILLSMRFNASVRTAELDRVVQKFALDVARWQFQPQYSFGASYNTNKSSGSAFTQSWSTGPSVSWHTPIGGTITTSAGANGGANGGFAPGVSVSITQPLIAGFGEAVTEAKLRDAYDTEKINKLNLRKTLMDQVTATISAYMGLVGDENSYTVDQQSLQRAKTNLFQTRKLIEAGQNPRSDEVQAKAQVAQALAQLQQDKSSITEAKYQLLETIGLKPTADITVSHDVPLQRYRLWSKERSIELSIANNIGYQTSVIGLGSLARDVMTAKDANRWSLGFSAGYSRGSGAAGSAGSASANPSNVDNNMLGNGLPDVFSNRDYSYNAGLTLNVPLDNMNNQQAILSAKIGLEKAEINLKQAKQNLIIKTMSDRDSLMNLRTQIKLDANQVSYDKQTLNNTILKYKAGMSSSFDVSQQSQAYANDQRTLVSQKIAYFNALASFDETCGHTLQTWGISVSDI